MVAEVSVIVASLGGHDFRPGKDRRHISTDRHQFPVQVSDRHLCGGQFSGCHDRHYGGQGYYLSMAASQTVKRAQVTAIRSTAAHRPPAGAVYAPWDSLASQAESRYKAEIAAALAELQADVRAADKILDTAHTLAADRAGRLEDMAWAAWARFMDMADRASRSILEPAATRYGEQIARSQARYEAAMDTAESGFKTVAGDIARAKADAAQASAGA